MQNDSPGAFSYAFHQVNGTKLHVGHLGPATGEIVIFLHGFPEFSQSWIEQAVHFAKKGYHVLAPDQRGYNLSSKPGAVADYAITNLVQDIAALITSLSKCPAIVVGHDWGGGVAWSLAQNYPDLVKKLIILNMPHPQVMKEYLRNNPGQMLKSWYAGFFQLPFIPEKICGLFNFRYLAMSMTRTARPGAFTHEYIAACKQAWSQPNAISGMINWYRAFFRRPADTDKNVEVPVLILWGELDTFLSTEMAGQSIRRCTNGQLIMIKNATHWLHHEEPDLINEYIFNFISQ